MMDIDSDVSVPVVYCVPIKPDRHTGPGAIDDSVVTMCDRAFFVRNCSGHEELLASVVLYNWSLLNHCRGVATGSSAMLSKALMLYKMVLVLLLKHKLDGPAANLLYMSVLNNMAHIHSHSFNIAAMKESLHQLFRALSQGGSLHAASEKEYVLFYMNTMFCHGNQLTLAPAA